MTLEKCKVPLKNKEFTSKFIFLYLTYEKTLLEIAVQFYYVHQSNPTPTQSFVMFGFQTHICTSSAFVYRRTNWHDKENFSETKRIQRESQGTKRRQREFQ